MIKVLKVHANAETEYGAMQEEYQIDLELDPALVAALMRLASSEKREYVGGMYVEANEYYFFDDGALEWAALRIGEVSLSIENVHGTFKAKAFAWKEAEGDQRLDQLEFYRKCDGYLPGNFWIEPAAVFRALLKVAA